MKFLGRFEFFDKGCQREKYDDFMRRWEKNRENLENASDDTQLIERLLGVLHDDESATITEARYLTVKGDKFAYTTRIVTSTRK